MIHVETLVFALIAVLCFSLAFTLIKALQAACIAFKWLAIILLLVFHTKSGGYRWEIGENWDFVEY